MLKLTRLLTVLSFALAPPGAHADPVRITSGTVSVSQSAITFRLSAPGFDVTGQGVEDIGSGVVFRDASPFRTGIAADLSADVTLRAAAQINSSTEFVLVEGALHFMSRRAPLRSCHTESFRTICNAGPTPFTLAGVLDIFDTNDHFAFSQHLVGRGFETGTLDDTRSTPGVGRPAELDFTFGVTPTPEPTSLLLVGIAAAALRLRRRLTPNCLSEPGTVDHGKVRLRTDRPDRRCRNTPRPLDC
jgi:hypothetical protein